MGARTQDEVAANLGWWVEGEFPVHRACRVHPLIDGRSAMLAMCRAFLSARDYILLAAWDIRADLALVRGDDARLGADGSPEQRHLLETLKATGMDDEACACWTAGELTVAAVLGFAVRRGVRVGVLLWDAPHLGSHITNDPPVQRKELEAVGVDCLLDDSSRRITHMMQALHQKCAVVDGRIAFVGGVDLTAQVGGDYDRWDTHHHHCASPVRLAAHSPTSHPWHDVHVQLEGSAVADVQRNIVERWMDVAGRCGGPDWPATAQPQKADAGDRVGRGVAVQIVRTIPPKTYAFAPDGISTIYAAYLHAIAEARRFIYIENQYLWPQVYLGLDAMRWGEQSPQVQAVLAALVEALDREVQVAIVLPDHPNCGRAFTDAGIEWLRVHAPDAVREGRLSVFTLGSSKGHEEAPGGVLYRPVYVHAKVAIVDDLWWTAGSANLNSRGLLSDAELNVTVLDAATAEGLRRGLWSEHLHIDSAAPDLDDPLAGLRLFRASAEVNQGHVERREALEAHVLPYLTAAEAEVLQLPFHAAHGWLDALEGGAGATADAYAEKYL